jgi:hypothetical protein
MTACPCSLPAALHACGACGNQYAHADLLRVEGGFVCRACHATPHPADALACRLYGADRDDARRSRTCLRCRHRVGNLADEDEREFYLSGLCPRCFDVVTT